MNKTCLIIHYMLCNVKDSRVPTILLHNPAHIATANKHSTTQVCALTCFTQFVFTHCSGNCMFFGHGSSRQTSAISEQKSVLYKNVWILFEYFLRTILPLHRDASDQKFKRNDGIAQNQLRKAMAVAVSNSMQWFWEQTPRSLPISTVMPAEAQAAANVRVEVTCKKDSIYKEMNGKESCSYSDASGWAYIQLVLNAQSGMWCTHSPKSL